MQDILRAIPSFLDHLDTQGAAAEELVFAAWRRIADDQMANNVVPLKLTNGRLLAAVPSEMWRRQVADLGPAFVKRLNDSIGRQLVKFIEFRVDEAAVEKARSERGPGWPSRSRLSELAEEQITPELTAAADTIGDDELRRRLLAAAGSSLARRKILAGK